MSCAKKSTVWLVVMLMLLALVTGCAASAQGQADPNAGGQGTQQSTDKLLVYATFYPMYDFASKIGGDKIELVNMLPTGGEPHSWEPDAADIVGLEKADVFIYNGAGMETWTDKVLASLENKSLIIDETSQGIELMTGHHHDDEEEPHDDADEEHHEEDEHSYDPHVWVSLRNAKLQMESIKNALSQADPGNADYYAANYEEYAAQLDALDAEFVDALAPVKNRNIVVSHQAFGYLCRDYDLTQIAVEGLTPDSEPDAARMVEIIEFCQENEVSTIFFEELASPKVAETIAKATGAKVSVLNPMGAISAQQAEAGEDYLSIMRKNLQALVEGLQ
ncbi:MAG: metal ABC transporter substrate-binding protein [Acetanaerobacterium sp.]